MQEANLDSACKPAWEAMKAQANVAAKMADSVGFNAKNQWRKRGVWAMPLKYLASGTL